VVENLFGEFHLSKKNNQVFGCGGNSLSQGEFATITNESGKIIEVKHQGIIQYCGITSNDEFYWIAYEQIVKNRIAAKIVLIDSNGTIVHSKIGSFDAENKVEFNGISENITLESSF
ncbi:MAG: hypothetical protein V2I33_01205, partial [Kangiellaceae bacterium]|nr:hypothetical protein [Kangiellaceae bacterium]